MRLEVLKEMLDKADRYHPVTREDICKTFHVGDRTARKMIEELREQGIRVYGVNDTEGYWLCKTQQEYERFRRDYTAKARTIYRRTKNMDAQTDERQVGMDELL